MGTRIRRDERVNQGRKERRPRPEQRTSQPPQRQGCGNGEHHASETLADRVTPTNQSQGQVERVKKGGLKRDEIPVWQPALQQARAQEGV